MDWRIAIISWGAFIIISALTRYISLGSMIGTALFPPAMLVFDLRGVHDFNAMALCAVLLIARHKTNIERLIRGKESKFSFRRRT
jgi:glycerol-3-phosphate acyltransferase PlsY